MKETKALEKKAVKKETRKERRARKKREWAEANKLVDARIFNMYKVACKTVFGKGLKACLVMLFIAVALSMVSLKYMSGGTVFEQGDELLGLSQEDQENNAQVLKDYLDGTKVGGVLDEIDPDISYAIISIISEKAGIVVQILRSNKDYVERNAGEIFGLAVVAGILLSILTFFLKNVTSVGQGRVLLENRYQRVPRIRRIFAPYGRRQFFHIFWVYIQFMVTMFLWGLTIIGYFYKGYQYRPIPYIMAENPTITWKQAKNISKQMTQGYKMKMFIVEMSTIPLWCLTFIPIVGPLLSLPIIMQLDAEWYVRLRRRTDIDRQAFIEPIFDGEAYVTTHTVKKEYRALIRKAETKEEKAALKKELRAHLKEENRNYPEYVMPDILIDISSFDEADKYKVTDFIVMFFTFCLVGWLWEVGLHIVRDHEFVNRGMMYGPWIPIYGFGGVFIIFFLNRFKNNKVKLVILTMILCGILEYLTSFVLDFAMNASYWDYKDLSFNLNGRICLAGLAAFAAGGFAGIYVIGPAIKGRLEKFGRKRTLILCTVLVLAFLTDFICCQIFGSNSGAGVGGTI